ncbi:MAG TPA: HEAT repeat domain-containing protein [Tepidisphaeraceae bacterium]|nr:HEAT repeat domain-containing protein [Tepidisphaeraceae bacterium]
MAKGSSNPRSLDAALRAVADMRLLPAGDLAPSLRPHLGSTSNLVVTKAADLAREKGLADLAPDLAAAFWRFMADPSKTDRGCVAKEAIGLALYELGPAGEDVEKVLLAGIRHFQREGSYGPPVDTAVGLRGWCAMGLVRIGRRFVHEELADLLADPEAQARMMAARAIAYAGHDAGVPLLRLKARAGDAEPGVTAEVLSALARLAPGRSVDVLRDCLRDSDDTVASAAALALGETRRPEALEALCDCWRAMMDPNTRANLALPIALTRLPAGVEFLVEGLAAVPESVAVEVVRALKMYRGDAGVKERVGRAVEARKSERLSREFETAFS